MSTWAILLAAGSGTRFGGRKQDVSLAGKPLWRWSYDVLEASKVDGIVVVGDGIPHSVPGGKRRQDSVAAGLAAVPADAAIILVHDAARPAVSLELVERVLTRCERGDIDGVVPALEVTDTIKVADGEAVVRTLDRENLVTIQTPQAFRASTLRRCHEAVQEDVTDDASMLEMAGYAVVVVAGEPQNLKVTHQSDLQRVKGALR